MCAIFFFFFFSEKKNKQTKKHTQKKQKTKKNKKKTHTHTHKKKQKTPPPTTTTKTKNKKKQKNNNNKQTKTNMKADFALWIQQFHAQLVKALCSKLIALWLWLTFGGSYYSYLEQTLMVLKMFEFVPLKLTVHPPPKTFGSSIIYIIMCSSYNSQPR